jgi:hypothetical protein
VKLFDDIVRRRNCGRVHCGIDGGATSVADVAQAFGLSPDPACYHEVTEATARAIAITILRRDLAYSAELLSSEAATELAAEFFQRSYSPGCRFFSNGDFSQDPPTSWMPATSATFDTGVLVLSAARTACLWVEDED